MADLYVVIQKIKKNSFIIMIAKVVEYLHNIKNKIVNIGSYKLPAFNLVSFDNNQYEFVKFINKGLHGSVYLIQDTKTKKLYACKKYKKKYKNKEELIAKKFRSEFCFEESTSNKNIIRLYEFIEHNNSWYAISEYCENGDLYTYCKNKRLCVDKIESLFKQLIDGLCCLHNKGVAHKNLKLENLLLDSKYNLIISDFSNSELYKTSMENERKRCSGLNGSEPYLAPETYTNAYCDSEKIDIFSCGVILYIFLFNHMPFSKACTSCHSYSYFVKHKDRNKDSLVSRLPKDIKILLLGMLEHDPNKRYSITDVKNNKWYSTIS